MRIALLLQTCIVTYVIVKERTLKENGSHGQHLRSNASATKEDLNILVWTTEIFIFISHAGKYNNFQEFLCALEAQFNPHEKLWIDIFCHNQHEELALSLRTIGSTTSRLT